MKTVIINGGPRKNWNTAQLLQSAMKGATDAGIQTEYYDLYDICYSGCRSCLACKKNPFRIHANATSETAFLL